MRNVVIGNSQMVTLRHAGKEAPLPVFRPKWADLLASLDTEWYFNSISTTNLCSQYERIEYEKASVQLYRLCVYDYSSISLCTI